MSDKINKSEKELGIGKILFIISTVFIITPILVLGIIYYTNDNFKMAANRYLVALPGPLGAYFNSYPTRQELDGQKVSIARYLVEIDNSRAIDKLTLIKNEDEVLYNEISKIMLRLKPNKTREIIDGIRRNLIKKDILLRTSEQIESERQEEVVNKAKYFESLSTITAIREIETDLDSNTITYPELAQIFQNMKKENSVYILKYLNEDVRENVIKNFSIDEKKRDIEMFLNKIVDDELKLKHASEIYSTESPEKLVSIIGNTDIYNIDDLSFIYKNIEIIKGAQILSKLDDEGFVHELVNTIKEKEILLNDEDLITDDMLKAYKIYRDFDRNINELTSIYEKMSEEQIAELTKEMIENDSNSQRYLLDNGEVISISDEDLALSILRKFNERKLAAILSNFDTRLASEITKKLSMPTL
ncbi:MAG: hypothetical protein MJA82_07745 [Clostridia bacterium]|nr:hypothetical protein [Clostridia bacterium]